MEDVGFRARCGEFIGVGDEPSGVRGRRDMRNGRDGGIYLAAGGDAIAVLRRRIRFGIAGFGTFRPARPGKVAAALVGGPRADSRKEKHGDQQEGEESLDAGPERKNHRNIMTDSSDVRQEQSRIFRTSRSCSVASFLLALQPRYVSEILRPSHGFLVPVFLRKIRIRCRGSRDSATILFFLTPTKAIYMLHNQ